MLLYLFLQSPALVLTVHAGWLIPLASNYTISRLIDTAIIYTIVLILIFFLLQWKIILSLQIKMDVLLRISMVLVLCLSALGSKVKLPPDMSQGLYENQYILIVLSITGKD